ncbi:hypothetical protein DFJ77DRAFT_509204 [Powellomyces hirtus]|nr:hypothetical protein DFJ77DRAFT_509204 [Powellomyces hirtus]
MPIPFNLSTALLVYLLIMGLRAAVRSMYPGLYIYDEKDHRCRDGSWRPFKIVWDRSYTFQRAKWHTSINTGRKAHNTWVPFCQVVDMAKLGSGLNPKQQEEVEDLFQRLEFERGREQDEGDRRREPRHTRPVETEGEDGTYYDDFDF